MHDININIIGAQQAENCEFKMRAIKPGCINYGTGLREFQQPRCGGLQCCFVNRNGLPLNSEQSLSW